MSRLGALIMKAMLAAGGGLCVGAEGEPYTLLKAKKNSFCCLDKKSSRNKHKNEENVLGIIFSEVMCLRNTIQVSK